MRKLAILSILSFILYSCEKDKPAVYSASLTGEWEWFISCGGFAGCTTPEETHTTMRLVFTSDSMYNNYYNDTLFFSVKFHTYKSISEDGKDTADILSYGNSTLEYMIYRDTLSLYSLTYISGSSYKRIK